MSARRAVVALAVGLVLGFAAVAHAQPQPQPQPQNGEGWEVRIPDKLELVAGAPGSLAIAIAVDRGMTISKDADVYVDLAPPAGVTIKRRRWQRADSVDPEADEPRFTVPVATAPSASAAADAAIAVHIRFWVCGSKVCKPVDVRRTVAVTIAAGAGT